VPRLCAVCEIRCTSCNCNLENCSEIAVLWECGNFWDQEARGSNPRAPTKKGNFGVLEERLCADCARLFALAAQESFSCGRFSLGVKSRLSRNQEVLGSKSDPPTRQESMAKAATPPRCRGFRAFRNSPSCGSDPGSPPIPSTPSCVSHSWLFAFKMSVPSELLHEPSDRRTVSYVKNRFGELFDRDN